MVVAGDGMRGLPREVFDLLNFSGWPRLPSPSPVADDLSAVTGLVSEKTKTSKGTMAAGKGILWLVRGEKTGETNSHDT